MRTYTTSAFIAGNLNKAENYNKELGSAVRILNGQLDQHQIPLETIDDTLLVDPTVYTNTYNISSYGGGAGLSTTINGLIGPVNAYYRVGPLTSSVTIPSVGKVTTNMKAGWNYINDLSMRFIAEDGMLKGSAVVSVKVEAYEETIGIVTAERGENNQWELAVFCNEQMIAQSGFVHSGIFTIDLPFSTLIASGPVLIVPAIRIGMDYDAINIKYPDTVVGARDIWCRNIIR